jgi:hypothetical protein
MTINRGFDPNVGVLQEQIANLQKELAGIHKSLDAVHRLTETWAGILSGPGNPHLPHLAKQPGVGGKTMLILRP